jgi:hypothetical protein
MALNPNNPYEFIMSEPAKTHHMPINVNNNSLKGRLLVVGGSVAILIIVMVVLFGVILKPSTKGADSMYQVAAAQQDIIGLTTLGKTNVKAQELLNSTSTISAVVNSHLYSTSSSISKSSLSKNSATKIKELLNSQYKATLDAAKINGTYDDTYKTLLSNRLDLYRSYLQTAYANVSSQTLKAQLDTEYVQASALTLSTD